jgi:hypothetical protein
MTQQSHSSQCSGGDCSSFVIVRGKKDQVAVLSCKRVDGIWYESECMFRENINGGIRYAHANLLI